MNFRAGMKYSPRDIAKIERRIRREAIDDLEVREAYKNACDHAIHACHIGYVIGA
jgi:hypothetical protein